MILYDIVLWFIYLYTYVYLLCIARVYMSSFANASSVFLSLSLRLVSSKRLNRWLRKSNPTKLHGRFDWGQQVRNNFDVSARSTDFGSLDNVAIGTAIMLKLRIRTTAAQQANYMVFACATMSLAVQLLRFPKDLMNHSHVQKFKMHLDSRWSIRFPTCFVYRLALCHACCIVSYLLKCQVIYCREPYKRDLNQL